MAIGLEFVCILAPQWSWWADCFFSLELSLIVMKLGMSDMIWGQRLQSYVADFEYFAWIMLIYRQNVVEVF